MEVKQNLTTVNFTKAARTPKAIVLHSMAGTQAGSIAWFKNPDAKASAHYCISAEGEIVQCVLDKDIAWHAGIFDEPIAAFLKPNPNNVTIGIELEDKRDNNWNYPQPQRDALKWLVDMLCTKYNIPKDKEHILLHKNLNPSRRSDPVGNFDINWVLSTPTVDQPADWLIHNSDQWRTLVWYLEIATDPEHTSAEDAKRVIAGFKSIATDAKNQLTEIAKTNAVLSQEVTNRKEQVSRLEQQLLQADQNKKAEIKAIMESMPNIDKLRGQYEGEIGQLKGELNEAKKEYGRALLKIAELETTNADQLTKINLFVRAIRKVRAVLLAVLKTVKK